MQQIVITAVGQDTRGLVNRLTEQLADYQTNIADSRMVNLAGQFAIVMLIEAPDSQAEALRQRLPEQVGALGLTLTTAPVREPGAKAGVPYRIRTYAMDQAGIVHRISHVLAEHGVNIEDLTTRLDHGPHTGTPLFSMDLVVTVPTDVPLKDVRDSLEKLCAEMNCDLDIDRR